MIWRSLFCVVFVLAASGCMTATKQPPAAAVRAVPDDRILVPTQAGENTGRVVITRDVGMLAGGCYLGVMVDGQLVAKLDRAERLELHLTAGDHVLTATAVGGRGLCAALQSDANNAAHRRSVDIVVRPGQVKMYRLMVPTEGYAVIEPAV